MSDLAKEAVINRRLEHDQPGRSFEVVEGSRWGELIHPSPAEAAHRTGDGLRVLAVTSFLYGTDVLDALLQYEQSYPDDLNVLALATDDAINAEAKIGLRKRLWKDYSQQERIDIETATVERALSAGVPVYTGELKIDWFYRQLAEWRPDAIIVCVCGQIFNAAILGSPSLGAYNFHPADLAQGHGAGAQFLEDNIARNDPWTRWTVHHMTETVDGGPIVGQSPPILIGDAAGGIPTDPRVAYEKFRLALHPMVTALADTLSRLGHNGDQRPIDRLDFEARVPSDIKRRLAQPTG